MLHEVINPATEEVVTSVELLDERQTDEAIARSRKAFEAWRAVAPADRARLLRAFADAVDADREHLAELEVVNSGHTIGNARWEAGNARDVIAYYAAAPERLIGQQIPVADGINVTFHEPLGVVGVIVPWNFPMPIASWGFAPALAAGNTVVLKPAELTPLTAIRIAELALEAGLPKDVFQVLPGKGSVVGQRFVDHADVAKIVFTGSTEVGRRVMAGCAARIKPVTLELGGKSANVVFADSDLERAAATAPYAVFDNAGQDCCARSRILVERSAYDRFLELLEPAVRGVVVTDPADEKAEMGPLISAEQHARVSAYVPDDAPVAFRGTAPQGKGFWFPPTVLTPSDPARPRAARRDLRACRGRRPVRRRGGRDPDRQRQRLRSVGFDLDPRRRTRAAREPRHREREPERQLALVGAVLDAVRRIQIVRSRSRTRPRRAARVHRDQERVHLDDEGVGRVRST